jgi:hypothetical protein
MKVSFHNRYTIFLRGTGGFSQSSKPFSYSARTSNLPKNSADAKASKSVPVEGAPDFVYNDQTPASQVGSKVYDFAGLERPDAEISFHLLAIFVLS